MRIPRVWKRVYKLSAVIIILITLFTVSFLVCKKYDSSRIIQLENQMNDNTKEIYVAISDIKKGSPIESNMVRKEKRNLEMDTSFLFTKEDFGMIAITDISADSPILLSLVTEQEDNCDRTQREINYTRIQFGRELKAGDYVDVRIRYLDGEDYIVVSKCKVTISDLDTQTASLLLSEEDQLMLSSALNDCFMYKATVYLAKYTHPNIQEATKVTYQPYIDVIDQIMNNTNIDQVRNSNLDITKRIAIEKRLFAYQKTYESLKEEKDKDTEEEKDDIKQDEEEATVKDQADSNTGNVVYYYDYSGQGVDSVLDSISNATNTQVKDNSKSNQENENKGVDNSAE